ncbi:MAG: hypothetical protein WA210_22395 [Burkholderiaceae bacterium]
MHRLLLLLNDPIAGEHLRGVIADMPDMEVSGLTVSLPQAMRSMKICPPDLVLVDWQVNRADFEHLLEELVTLPRDSRPSVLVGTLSLDDPELMEAIAQGADGYYLHGSSSEILRGAILQVLAGESPMAPHIARRAKLLLNAAVRAGIGLGGNARAALRLDEAQMRMLERIGDGYLVREIAREWRTTEHDIGLGIRMLYRKLQFDHRAAGKAGQLN